MKIPKLQLTMFFFSPIIGENSTADLKKQYHLMQNLSCFRFWQENLNYL